MHYYNFHPSDYLNDTAHLDPMEDLAYRRLLDLYYQTEEPIPLETQWVARRLRLGSEVVSRVLKEFFVERETGWHQLRADCEIADYKANAEKNRRNGKLGGRPKKTQSVATGNPLATQTKANQEPITKNHKPKYRATKGTLEDLQAFAREIGLPASDGESMFYHWESNGWKNGNAPVKDWKAGIRKWKSQGWLPSQKANGQKKTDRRNML